MNSEAAQLSETPVETPLVFAEPSVGAVHEPPLPEPAEMPAADSASDPAAQNPRALLKTLQAQFPAFRDCLPLSIGIDKAIKAALPEVSKKTLRIALSLHTHGNRYLRGMAKATQRFDLDGAPTGEVTDEHRQHATDILRERMKKQADERRAAQKAEREQQKSEPQRQDAQKAEDLQAPGKQPTNPKPRKHAQPKGEHKQPTPVREVDAGRVTADKLALLAQKFARR